jgi:hypothetical protein
MFYEYSAVKRKVFGFRVFYFPEASEEHVGKA